MGKQHNKAADHGGTYNDLHILQSEARQLQAKEQLGHSICLLDFFFPVHGYCCVFFFLLTIRPFEARISVFSFLFLCFNLYCLIVAPAN